MSDYQGRTYYLEGNPYTVEKTIAEGKVDIKDKYSSLWRFGCKNHNEVISR